MTFERLSICRRIFVAGAAAALVSGSALAHHGFSSYLEEDHVLRGVVTAAYFGFPHAQMTVEADDGETWTLWLAAYGRVRFTCLNEILVTGDTIKAFGHRDADLHIMEMKAERVELNGEIYDFYPTDNPAGANANPKRTEPCPT